MPTSRSGSRRCRTLFTALLLLLSIEPAGGTESFTFAAMGCLPYGRHPGGDHRVALAVGVGELVGLLAGPLHLVQRRLGNKDVTTIYEFSHLPEEEGQQQCANMRAINVSVTALAAAKASLFLRITF